MNDRFRLRAWNGERMLYSCPRFQFHSNQNPPIYENGIRSEGFPAEGVFNRHKVMQCTGIRDKNGQLIYEGDIVRIGVWRGAIEWSEDCLCFCHEDKPLHFYNLSESTVKVIGNIYENPELLA